MNPAPEEVVACIALAAAYDDPAPDVTMIYAAEDAAARVLSKSTRATRQELIDMGLMFGRWLRRRAAG